MIIRSYVREDEVEDEKRLEGADAKAREEEEGGEGDGRRERQEERRTAGAM
jgi:hypothetical protein